ncbi:MAG TPA: hypothetical protein VG389_10665 [Myxococcota bacterium]|nr:hypothetical protein [Myxococcota bacterium]
MRVRGAIVLAVLLAGCDGRVYLDVVPPVVDGVLPLTVRAGRTFTILAHGVELTPWDSGDVPATSDDPDPWREAPYGLEVRVDEGPADVLAVGTGGVVARMPAEAEPGLHFVRVVVEGVESNATAIEVVAEPLLEISIAPDPLRVRVGESRPVAVYGLYGDGRVEPVADEALVLVTADGRVARVTAAGGAVEGRAAGATVLSAVLGTLHAEAGVVVEVAR